MFRTFSLPTTSGVPNLFTADSKKVFDHILLLGGIAGAKPAAPQSAGNTQALLMKAPGASDDNPQGESPGIGMQINGMTVQASNADQFAYSMQEQYHQYQGYRLQCPPNNPGRG